MGPNENPDPTASNHELDAAARLAADVAMLCQLVADGFEVDGEAVLSEDRRWIVYGRSAYDGEVVLAEYDDAAEASAVLGAVPRRRPAQ